MSDRQATSGASTRRLARTRGAASGLLLVALGAWGALVPFIGPSFDFAYSPDKSWKWTAARGWLEVLPGSVTAVGGLLLLFSASRLTTLLGAWFGIAGGAWFIVGPHLAAPFRLGTIGSPTGSSTGLRALEALAYFFALGAVILFLAATAFGRLSVVTVRDVRVAERREAARIEAEEAAAREIAARNAAERDAAAREPAERDAAARRDMAAREPARRDMAAREAARRDMAAREADERTGARGATAVPPTAVPPTAAPPTAAPPTAAQPANGQPANGQPANGQPTVAEPATEEPAGRHDPAVVGEQQPGYRAPNG